MKYSYSTSPIVDAEIAFRQQQIAHDFAVAHGWELSVRRLFGRRRRPAEKQPAPRPNAQVLTPGRLGWR
ncbi:MAG TPA: hypothetical protein VG502_15350 [Flexivirga sp.]|uniref:hypothetical protein n=1 Tax=Flexivirga sp. TaxID=1962927 RepID=UPI002BC3D450|nr:hypothetical protein [Flexivirga sp.]HWC23668.1 hypothetical protein [Flexivirga sp.]